MDKELLKGSLDIILLVLLSKKELYGYEIARLIKEYSNLLYEIGEGTLYPALKRLEDKKLLDSYWGETDKGGRRKYYKITLQGKVELEQKLASWKTINDLIFNCLKGGE